MASDKTESRYKASREMRAQFEHELDDLDGKISRLRVLYDQYFMGIEKMEPMYLRGEVQKRMRRSQIPKLGSTVLKFRFRSLQQRFTSYMSYWDRIVRLIEEGKIRRGIATTPGNLPGERAAKERPGDDEQMFRPAESLQSRRRRFRRRTEGEGEDLAAAAREAAAQLGGPGEAKPAPAPREYGAGDVEGLYERLVAEKRRAGESTDKLTPGTVRKSVDRILDKMKGRDVRFRIVTKDGKVNLTAVVKKG